MWKKLFILPFMIVGIVACNDDGQQEDVNQDAQPMNYESQQEQAQKMETKSLGDVGGYHQSEQRGVNAPNRDINYTGPYTTEDTIYLANELRKRKEIVQAQVAETEEDLIVGVMLTDDGEKEVTNEMVKDFVRELVPHIDKEIIIFTDDVEWNHLKDIDSRLEGDLKEEFEFFYKDRYEVK